MRSRVRTLASLALGTLFLAAIVAYVGVEEIAGIMARASLPLIGAALLTYASFFFLRGVRWSLILAPVGRVSVQRTAGYSAIGWLVNTLVPMRAGEFARAGLLTRRDKIPFASGLSSIGVERVLDLLGLAAACGLAFATLPRVAALPGAFKIAVHIAWVLPLVLLVGIWATSRRPDIARVVVARTVARIPRLGERLAKFSHALVDGATALFANPRALPAILALSIGMTVAQIGVYVLLFRAFVPGADPLLLFAGFPFFILSFIIHVTPGNVGTYEAAFIAVFSTLGFPVDTVAPVSILTHASTAGFVIFLGTLAGVALGAHPLRATAFDPQGGPDGIPAAPTVTGRDRS